MPSGQSPSSNSIIVGNCISCEGLVRVSAKTKANADVRCPHCQQTFPLLRLLESAVPEVEIVGSETSPAVTAVEKPGDNAGLYIDKTSEVNKDAAGKFVVPSQLSKGARRRKSSRSGRSRSGSRSSSRRSESDSYRDNRSDSDYRNDGGTTTQEAYKDTSLNGSSLNGSDRTYESSDSSDNSSYRDEDRNDSHRSTRHRDRREAEADDSEPNPAVTVLKVFAGAALALPIAYLIVMWVFARDPLGIGQQLGEKMPFIVPSSLRADTQEVEDSSSDDDNIGFNADDSDSDSSRVDFGFGNLNIGSEALEGLDK